jgi:hypothetical protein
LLRDIGKCMYMFDMNLFINHGGYTRVVNAVCNNYFANGGCRKSLTANQHIGYIHVPTPAIN